MSERKSIILTQLQKRRKTSPTSQTQINSQLELTETTDNLTMTNNNLSKRKPTSGRSVEKEALHENLTLWRLYMIIFAVIALLSVLILVQLETKDNGFLDHCAVHVRPKTHYILFRGATICIVLCFIALLIRFNLTKNGVFVLVYTASWYHVSWGIGIFLKNYLQDHNCNVHANSVSGHFHFFIFALLTIPFLYYYLRDGLRPVERNSPSVLLDYQLNSSRIFYAVFILLILTASACMLETYIDGYHSPRQIFYGIILAIISHCLFVSCILHVKNKVYLCVIVLVLCLAMFACSTLTNTLKKVLIPNVVGMVLSFGSAIWLEYLSV